MSAQPATSPVRAHALHSLRYWEDMARQARTPDDAKCADAGVRVWSDRLAEIDTATRHPVGPTVENVVARLNAVLICAAPALLAALQDLLAACEQQANADGGEFGPIIGPAAYAARAAIAAAQVST